MPVKQRGISRGEMIRHLAPVRQRNVIMKNPLSAKLIRSALRQRFDAVNSAPLVS